MHVHILGICGTFMGGVATLAKQLGHQVSGSDQNVYPPMSSLLEQQGIELMAGYCAENLNVKPDLVVIGNALSRGNPEVEAVLNRGLAYTSGPAWLSQYLLQDRWVLAVAGTHGKTTTSSLLTWILEDNGMDPGFLIGGAPNNFGSTARLGGSQYFVVEADEYDSAFFDKRSKFVHYRPTTAILNNLEFDHADIFGDLAAIKTQFHHFVRTIPEKGLIIMSGADKNLAEVLEMGCWTPVQRIAVSANHDCQWHAELTCADDWTFDVFFNAEKIATVDWELSGTHNIVNALSAIAAANHIGIQPADAIASLPRFKGIKRRMEIFARYNGITLYDDFAHHPTAIALTLEGLRRNVSLNRIIAVVEPRSNTMRMGVHKETLADSFKDANLTFIYQPDELCWDLEKFMLQYADISIFHSINTLVDRIVHEAGPGDHIVFMSNGGFSGIHRLVEEGIKAHSRGSDSIDIQS